MEIKGKKAEIHEIIRGENYSDIDGDPINSSSLPTLTECEEAWNNYIVKVNRGFDVEYYDNYIGSVKVEVLDKQTLKTKYWVEYREAYPKVINSIPFNHSTTNQTVRVTASIVYSFYVTEDTDMTTTQGKTNVYTQERLEDYRETGEAPRGF